MNEILGRSSWAPSVFGCQAPDSGNAEVLAHYGTEEQKRRYLEPLLRSEVSTTYAMTEPQAGPDPNYFTCQARKDGDEWVINGKKWFASNYKYCERNTNHMTGHMTGCGLPNTSPVVPIKPVPTYRPASKTKLPTCDPP